MTEKTLKNWMIQQNLSILEGSMDQRIDAMRRVIEHGLPRKSVSDRTCHKRIVRWICGELEKERIDPVAFLKRLIDAVIEATNPSVKNPNAVFITILKKEFGYERRQA